jgi:hypothetical protein
VIKRRVVALPFLGVDELVRFGACSSASRRQMHEELERQNKVWIEGTSRSWNNRHYFGDLQWADTLFLGTRRQELG